MSPTIRIDQELYAYLQERAEAFVDTPNTVIQRLLGLDFGHESGLAQDPVEQSEASGDGGSTATSNGSGHARSKARRSASRKSSGSSSRKKSRKRATPGSILAEEEYIQPFLVTLLEMGGSATAGVVIDAVGEKLQNRLTDVDREPLKSGLVRWKNRVQFTRMRLAYAGLLKKDSPRGIWELSETGRAQATELMNGSHVATV